MKEILEDKPIAQLLEDKPIAQLLEDKPFVTDRSPIKDRAYHSATPFISVDPVTGKRKEVATAQVVSHHGCEG